WSTASPYQSRNSKRASTPPRIALTRLGSRPYFLATWAAVPASRRLAQVRRSAVVRTVGGFRRERRMGRLDAVPPVATRRSTSPSGAWASSRKAALRRRARSSGRGGSDREGVEKEPEPTYRAPR